MTFFYPTNPYHFANSNEVKHDNYFCGVGNWNGYGVWTMDHPKNPILSFTQAPTTWDGPMRKPREEAFKVPKKEAKESSHQERDKTLPTQDKMDF